MCVRPSVCDWFRWRGKLRSGSATVGLPGSCLQQLTSGLLVIRESTIHRLGYLRRVHSGAFAKHLKSFSLMDCISVGVDRSQQRSLPALPLLPEHGTGGAVPRHFFVM